MVFGEFPKFPNITINNANIGVILSIAICDSLNTE